MEIYVAVNPAAIKDIHASLDLTDPGVLADPATVIPQTVSYQAGWDGEAQTCFSLHIDSPRSRLLYDADRRLPSGASVYLVTSQAVQVNPISPVETSRLLRELTGFQVVHTNVHVARSNAKLPPGAPRQPIIAVRKTRAAKATYCMAVDIHGPCYLLTCPNSGGYLKCGAKVYLIAPKGVRVEPIDVSDLKRVMDDMRDDMEDTSPNGYVQDVLI